MIEANLVSRQKYLKSEAFLRNGPLMTRQYTFNEGPNITSGFTI